MPRKTMIEAIRDAMDVMMERDADVVVFGEDVGFFGGVFRATRGPADEVRHARAASTRRSAKAASSAPPSAWRAYGLRPVRRDPVRRLHLSGLRPDRLGGGAPALSLGRRVHLPDHRPHADRRRHLRRPDAQPEPRGAVHPCVRPQDGDPVQSVRRQGPADRCDRGRRSGDLPRAEAALQRAVRRPSRPAGDALVEACARRGARRPLRRAARQAPSARGRGV